MLRFYVRFLQLQDNTHIALVTFSYFHEVSVSSSKHILISRGVFPRNSLLSATNTIMSHLHLFFNWFNLLLQYLWESQGSRKSLCYDKIDITDKKMKDRSSITKILFKKDVIFIQFFEVHTYNLHLCFQPEKCMIVTCV